jgi:hypothetical protein
VHDKQAQLSVRGRAAIQSQLQMGFVLLLALPGSLFCWSAPCPTWSAHAQGVK